MTGHFTSVLRASFKFITPSIHFCLQHVCRDAARRAGLSATADTCNLYCLFSYLRQGSYVIVVVCLSVSKLAQKLPNGFA